MSIKPIIVDSVDAYTIPLKLRDGTDFELKLKEGFTMSNEDADKLLQYGVDLFNEIGKDITGAGIDKLLTEEQLENLSDQERQSYMKKLESVNKDKKPLTESSVNRRIISFAYDVSEDWLYKNTNPDTVAAIMEHVQGWIGIRNAKKS